MIDSAVFYSFGIGLIVVGITIIVLTIIQSSSNDEEKRSKVKGAGVIMIGPFPIIFGTDKKSIKEVITLTAVIMLIIIIIAAYWLLR